jgi:hypothetical protein
MTDTDSLMTEAEIIKDAAFDSHPGGTEDCIPKQHGVNCAVFRNEVRSSRRSLSDRLTSSLITSGLVSGITPTSIRKKLGAVIPDSALWPLDGASADGPKTDCSSSKGRHHDQ